MATNRSINKCIAVLLILVFSQKMGGGLFLHNWLHATKIHDAGTTPISNSELKYACTCINDFTAPVTETPTIEIPRPVSTSYVPVAVAITSLPVVYKYFHSLRAPPAYSI